MRYRPVFVRGDKDVMQVAKIKGVELYDIS
jgi:hypothetical protein